MGIGISLLAVAACSWFIIYISHRFMRLEMPVERTAAKIFIYLFKVIVQQGTANELYLLIAYNNCIFTNQQIQETVMQELLVRWVSWPSPGV